MRILLKRFRIYRRSRKLFFSTPHAQILSEVIPVNVVLVIPEVEKDITQVNECTNMTVAQILTNVLMGLTIVIG